MVYDAVAFCLAEQDLELLVSCRRIDVEFEPNCGDVYRDVVGNPKSTAKCLRRTRP